MGIKFKTQSDNLDELLFNYQESLKNLGRSGIRTVVYNFMPVLDWARTNLNYTLASGEESMYFDFPTFVAFDVFILKRPGANIDYSSSLLEKAELDGLISGDEHMMNIDQVKSYRTVDEH